MSHLVLIQKHLQLFNTDSEVSLVELVGYVPTEGPKVPPLLH